MNLNMWIWVLVITNAIAFIALVKAELALQGKRAELRRWIEVSSRPPVQTPEAELALQGKRAELRRWIEVSSRPPVQTPDKAKRRAVISREITEISGGSVYILPRMGIVRCLWVELPPNTKRVRVTVDNSWWMDAETRFLPVDTRNILRLEDVLPLLKEFNSESYYQVRIDLDSAEKFAVHRRIDQVLW